MSEKLIELIENPQKPDRQGHDHLSIEEIMGMYNIPGVSISLIKDFKLQWSTEYGVKDKITNEKVNSDTLFQAASISKSINAMAVLKAAELGYFSLDDDVNKCLTSWKLPENPYGSDIPITPRMLASHTSGLGDGFGFPGYNFGCEIPTIIDILNGDAPSNVAKPEFDRPPYAGFKYSGASYLVLQQLLVDCFDKTYSEIISELVFRPLEMANSTFDQGISENNCISIASAHDAKGIALDCKWKIHPESAAAGLWTTSENLAKFVLEIQKSLHGKSNRVLSKESALQMVSPVGVGDYGIGFRVFKGGQGWFFEHGGSNWGFRSRLLSHRLKGDALIIMTNGSQGGELIDVIKERVEWHYGWDTINKPFI